ncbi:hypothetical protein [Labedella endophytica]|uniref:Uncharacterized protein n=1 Tax=Labedella endophytica TaxID=1523160 RepID=A0A433JTU3_9MICO|nr:hypothetical protein [Labedella endophytica]RUR01465.1 hypothetical protein ELQ94_08190 [Labedella endophytica]
MQVDDPREVFANLVAADTSCSRRSQRVTHRDVKWLPIERGEPDRQIPESGGRLVAEELVVRHPRRVGLNATIEYLSRCRIARKIVEQPPDATEGNDEIG